ncbi:YtzC family protein [bacterium LRH843]|nr:YtzC family protein [bacterium LRH843]
MAEMKQVEQWLDKARETIDHAEQVFEDSQRVQVGDPEDYLSAQMQLEEVNSHLDALVRAATPEQRDQLIRTQQQLRQIQNHMILRR